MTARQRLLPLALITGALLALNAFESATGTPANGRPTTERPSNPPAPAAQPDLVPRMAIAYDLGGRGSAGVNELAWEGLKRAADAYGAELKEITPGPADTDTDREERLMALADALYYPIFAVGPTWAGPVARVAPRYPRTWFVIVDDGTVDAPNVIGITFNEAQGSFLVGAAAALTSKTGNVGFVGAAQTQLLQRLEAGFTAGARAVNPDIEIQVSYLSGPPGDPGVSDPSNAREAALAMYDAGADVVFGVAGDSGDGVVQAAHERGLWAIGVDSDQHRTSDPSRRSVILTSMLKRADVVTYTIAMEVANGVPKDGNNVFGLDRDGVGYATSGGFVDLIIPQLEAFAAGIASGEIVVPRTP